MASWEARYLARTILECADLDGGSDMSLVSGTVLALLGVEKSDFETSDELADVLDARFPNGTVPTWVE